MIQSGTFDSALRHLWPHSDLRIPGLRAAMVAQAPALFVENQGQWSDASVRFMHQGDGANVAMTDTGPVFQVFRREAAADAPAPTG